MSILTSTFMDQLRLTAMSMNTSMIMHTNIVPIPSAMNTSIPASMVNIITSTLGRKSYAR